MASFVRAAFAGLIGVAGPAAAIAGADVNAAGADGVHPWHDAIAEVRVVPGESRLEVSMRVDGPHLEAMVAEWSRTPVDLERATGGSDDELRLAAYIRASMEARFVPDAGPDAAATPVGDRFDFHWYGREFEGTDCWFYFQWVAPPVTGETSAAAAPNSRPVQVRSTVLIDPAMRQVNTVSVLDHAAVTFSAGRTDWAAVDLRMTPRVPRPLRVARAGDAGPRILLLPGPAGPGPFERELAAQMRAEARVEIAFWPGTDGEAPPPTVGASPQPWADWMRRCLRATIGAAGAAEDPVVLVLTHPAARSLWAPDQASRAPDGLLAVIRVADGARTPGGEPATSNRFDASIQRRYLAESLASDGRRSGSAFDRDATPVIAAIRAAMQPREASAAATSPLEPADSPESP